MDEFNFDADELDDLRADIEGMRAKPERFMELRGLALKLLDDLGLVYARLDTAYSRLDRVTVPPPASSGGWRDPVTGLISGPVDEPVYDLRCQHCPEAIRLLENGFYEDRRGFMRCQKDMDHKPMLVESTNEGSDDVDER
jgi:hypothetical protein